MIYDIMIYDIMIYDIMIKMNYSNRTKLFDLKETFSAPFKSQISLVSLLGVKQSYSLVGKMYPLWKSCQHWFHYTGLPDHDMIVKL